MILNIYALINVIEGFVLLYVILYLSLLAIGLTQELIKKIRSKKGE